MLQVEGLMKSFDDFMAVNGANLTVGKGEIVAVIGPNGAGKTTLFNLITGALKRDRGRIIFKGEDISELPPYEICKKGISRSYQIVNIFPRLTVFEKRSGRCSLPSEKEFQSFPAGSEHRCRRDEKYFGNRWFIG